MPTQPIVREAMRGRRRAAITATLLIVCHQIGEALVPIIIGATIDRAISTGDGSAMAMWTAILVVDFAFLSLSWRFGSRFNQLAVLGVDYDLRLDVARRIVDRRGMRGPTRHRGELLSIATSDTHAVGSAVSVAAAIVSALAALLVAGVAMFTVSFVLGLLVIAGSALLLWLTQIVGGRVEQRSADEQRRTAEAAAVATDLVTALRTVKGIGAEKTATAKYVTTSQTLCRSAIRMGRTTAGIDATTTLLNGLFLAVVALVGARLADSGSIRVGQLIAAVGLAQFLVGPWSRLASASASFARVRASAQRVGSVLDAPHTIVGGTRPATDPTAVRLEVRGVTHATLRDVSIQVRHGEFVAVVAPEPADAAALIDCMGRRIDPDEGTVLLDGTSMGDLDPAAIDEVILVNPRHAEVFAGSLIGNIEMSSSDADGARIAVEVAAAEDVLRSVEDRADGDVTEHGSTLSGGQRQRIALARAVATNRSILVLNEPTSSVDSVTETTIATRLREARTGMTTIVVTTSPALLNVADRVIVIAGGRHVASGQHSDLIRDDLNYAALVTS